MSQKLSVVIITLNEEEIIEACLNAAWQVADEIVVIDSYSTDSTKEICLANGVKFIEHIFEGHIQQKNYAVTQATYDNILSLDADEIVSEKLATSILNIKQDWEKGAYYLLRRSHYCGKFINYGDWYPDKKIRLFRKDSGKWDGINPHDTFELNKGISLGKIKGDLKHYTFNTVAEHIKQANKFSTIGAREHLARHTRVNLLTLVLHPSWRFIRSYILRLGFLDGLRGFTIAYVISIETYLKYLKVLWPIDKQPFNDHRILQISSMKNWRGGEQQVAYLIMELRTLGKEVYMVVSKGSKLEQFCIDNNFQYSRFRFGNGFNLFAAWKLKAIIARHQIDLVHMHCSPSHTLAIVSNLLGNKAKMVLSRRVDFPIKNNPLSIKKYNFGQIENILCVSNKINSIVSPVIKNQTKIKTVYSGIDLNKFSTTKGQILRKQYGIDKENILIGNIASIANHKDYFTFIDTAEMLLKGGLKSKFFIIGDDGGEEQQIRTYVKEKHLENDIIFTGFRTDINKILPELDIFLFTSKEEGLGTSVLDAMASGVPVVATRAGGIPEMVTNGQNGLLCGIQSPEELANAIIRVVQNDELRESIVRNGKTTAQKFSKEKTAAETMACYMDILT
jgi:glycosyltransferase involved in cell wall biosynthesis